MKGVARIGGASGRREEGESVREGCSLAMAMVMCGLCVRGGGYEVGVNGQSMLGRMLGPLVGPRASALVGVRVCVRA